MLAGEFREIAMHGFRMTAFCLQLDGQMLDLEFARNPMLDRLEQIAGQGLIIPVHLHMRGQHDKARFNGPDVQVVDIPHAWNGLDGGRDLGRAHAWWCGLQQYFK